MTEHYQIAVIGAGMAGASLAAEIGDAASVVVLEAEDQPGYHSTGRSAAFWEECYGGPAIVPLTLASGSYLEQHGFLHNRGALYLARERDDHKIDQFFTRFEGSGAQFERIGKDTLGELVPQLKPEWDRAIWQPRCADIDVAGLHAHYIKRASTSGARFECRARVTALSRAEIWRIELAGGRCLSADFVVNAAGAWADEIAKLAHIKPLAIQPYRRTVVQLRVDPAPDEALPLCLDISGNFYFKPENGRLWLSPHDETPDLAHDVAPDEMDIAIAIDRLEKATHWKIGALERKWAGLRSFSPDRSPVYGWDPRAEGFFWFAGQGGYGIQTAPAAARLGAQLLLRKPPDQMTANLNPEIYDPARFG